MNEEEYAEVLQYLQRHMRDSALASVNDRIIADIRLEPGSASTQVLRYLDTLRAEVQLGTDASVRRIVERLRETVGTESGRPVDGLRLVFSPADRDLFGTDAVDLGVTPNLDLILHEIDELRNELGQSREAGL